jgi:hypothetical protein
MRRTYVLLAVASAAVAVVLAFLRPASSSPSIGERPSAARQAARSVQLPVTHVYLFSSGVGYFQREGEIEGTTNVNLSFPASDVNDLLKSLVVQDTGGGKITTIGYDSQDPVEKTLKSFSLDLTNNPTFGQLLNQARGEKVEVTLQANATTQPASLNGIIVGMEAQAQSLASSLPSQIDYLNLLCGEGVRSVPLKDVQRVRFLNPVLDAELRRALEVLAAAHDSQKKNISIGVKGDGKRTVKVGYVVENPIWKSSYRLVLDKSAKVHLQGWASVENTTDDDWNNVHMALISGRPISFQMNLYEPLFVPRPTVEPETFASLRPPLSEGTIQVAELPQGPGAGTDSPARRTRVAPTAAATFIGGAANIGFAGGAGLGGFGGFGGGAGFAGNLGGNFGLLGSAAGNPYQGGSRSGPADSLNKITWEEMQRRRAEKQASADEAKKVGSALSGIDPTEGIGSLPGAEEIGDYFRYVIDDKVTLPRQKSAMLAIVNQTVEAQRVSVYNHAVQAKFPLLGLRFKNLTNQPLTQGPVTVYEEGSYAGDARLPDLQPKEERLLTYALDQGTEVKAEAKSGPRHLVAVKVAKGIVHATRTIEESRTYTIRNRAKQDRTLIVEHPYRSEWKLKVPAAAQERTRDHYRFQLVVPAGKTVVHEVVEEQSLMENLAISDAEETAVRLLINHEVASPRVREGLKKALELRSKLVATRAEEIALENRLKAFTEDQFRLRANLERMPKDSAAYKRYIDKFDKQETEVEKLQAQIAKTQETLQAGRKEFEDFVMSADW